MKMFPIPVIPISKGRVSCEVYRIGATGAGDFAAYEDHHLRRREDRSMGLKLYDEWQ